MQRIIRKLDELNEVDLALEHVRTGTIVRLPFHLCTGSILQIVDPENDRLEIWLRNKLSIPHDAAIHEAWVNQGMSQIARSSPDDFLTDALIINHHPELRPGEFEAIRTGKHGAIGFASPQNPGFRFLNEVVAAHQMIRLGPFLSGMGGLWPRMLTEREAFERILVDVVLLADPDRTIDSQDVLRLFDNVDQLALRLGGGGMGDLRDYSSEQLSAMEVAVCKIRNHAFYEIKTRAIAAMLAGDSIVAIVLACAALEGAHGAFMRLALRDKVPGDCGKFKKFVNDLLREQGFYSLVQLSVRVLMKKEERPTEDELKLCLNGVTIRNAIMHAGIRASGKYRIREFTRSQTNEGYGGIMAVYRAFEAAVEARDKS